MTGHSKRTRLVPIVAGLIAVGCEADPPTRPDVPDLASLAKRNAGAVRSESIVFTGTGEVLGSSQLVRTAHGVSYSLRTSGLEPGHAYTLWIVVFNNPAACATPYACGEPDIVGNAAAQPDMLYAAGHVVGGSGTGTFGGHLKVGDGDGSVSAPVAGLPAYTLLDPYGAMVIFALHDHGPMLPAYMPDMITSVAGGCTNAGLGGVLTVYNAYTGPEFGRRGPNQCQTVQFSVHLPAPQA